jgi:hypothetical protein
MNKTKKIIANKKPLKKKTTKKTPLKRVNVKKDNNINTNTIKINIGNTAKKPVYKRSYNITKAKTQERQNINPYANPYINFNNNTHQPFADKKIGSQLDESLKLIKNQNDRFDELHRSVNSLLVPKAPYTSSLSYISNPVNQAETQTEPYEPEPEADERYNTDYDFDYEDVYPKDTTDDEVVMQENEMLKKKKDKKVKKEAEAKIEEPEAKAEELEAKAEEPIKEKKSRALKEYGEPYTVGKKRYVRSNFTGESKDITNWVQYDKSSNIFIDPDNPKYHLNTTSGIYSSGRKNISTVDSGKPRKITKAQEAKEAKEAKAIIIIQKNDDDISVSATAGNKI